MGLIQEWIAILILDINRHYQIHLQDPVACLNIYHLIFSVNNTQNIHTGVQTLSSCQIHHSNIEYNHEDIRKLSNYSIYQ